jgi:hypothetical protein
MRPNEEVINSPDCHLLLSAFDSIEAISIEKKTLHEEEENCLQQDDRESKNSQQRFETKTQKTLSTATVQAKQLSSFLISSHESLQHFSRLQVHFVFWFIHN